VSSREPNLLSREPNDDARGAPSRDLVDVGVGIVLPALQGAVWAAVMCLAGLGGYRLAQFIERGY